MGYAEDLVQLLTSNGQVVSRFRIRQFLTEPLRNPLLSQRIAQVSPSQSFSANPDVQKIVASIVSIWRLLGAGDTAAALAASIAAIGVVGAVIKLNSAPTDLIATPTLIAVLQGLAVISRHFSPAAKSGSQAVLDALRLEYAHLRRDARADPQKLTGMVICLIEIIKICVIDRAANPGIVDSLLASAQGILEPSALSKSVSTTFDFFLAKHLLFLDDFEHARRRLLAAATNCHPQSANEAKALFYLIPLQMSRGLFPTKKMLQKHPLLLATYAPLIKSIKRCDLKTFHKLTSPDTLLARTFFGLLRRIERYIYRGLLRMIFQASGLTRRVDMALFDQFVFTSASVAEDIAAGLISEGLISGYMSYEERALMLTGPNPFPPLV